MSKQPLNNFVLRWALTFISLVLLIYFAFFHRGHIQSGKEHGCCSAAHEPVSSSLSSRVPYNETSCSGRAFQVGGNQKVIAYVYYDDPENTMTESRKYFYGIEVNAEVNQRLYPGWRMWVYHDVNEGSDKFRFLSEIASKNENLELCDIRRNPMLGMARGLNPRTWRFLPLIDDQVDIVISRDLDSLASNREVSAVDQWLASKHPFHIMRDHPAHDAPILAGMWGVKLEPVRQALRLTMLEILKDGSSYAPRNVTSNDQAILGKYIWPWAKDLVLQHDSYTCQMFAKTRPWPTMRSMDEVNNYVGSPFALNTSVSEECPERCRPRDHPEWTHC